MEQPFWIGPNPTYQTRIAFDNNKLLYIDGEWEESSVYITPVRRIEKGMQQVRRIYYDHTGEAEHVKYGDANQLFMTL